MTYRYFFALWPDGDTRDRLAQIATQLPVGAGKRVKRDHLHITLSFLGPQDAAVVEKLRRDATAVSAPSFSLILDQSGWWRKPRVAWLGAARPPLALQDLVTAINGLLPRHAIHPDPRPYQAHLTIARKVAKNPGELTFDPVTWTVGSFCLVQSRTLPEGAVYEVIETWPLSSV